MQSKKTEQTKKIKIWWEGPFSSQEVTKGSFESFDIKPDDHGLYQIYATHPLYGDSVLVYIGKTLDSFRNRLKNRWVVDVSPDVENVQIYLGKLSEDRRQLSSEDEKKLISLAESLLIYALKPAYNSSNIQGVGKNIRDNDFSVYNYNSRRSLYPVFDSNFYFSYFANVIAVDNMATEFGKKMQDKDDEQEGFIYGFDIRESSQVSFCLCIEKNLWAQENIPLILQVIAHDSAQEKLKKISGLKYSEEFDRYYYVIEEDFFNKSKDKQKECLVKKMNNITDKLKYTA